MTSVALLDAPFAHDLAGSLRGAGVDATVVRAPHGPEGLLRRRGFTGPLTHVPFATLALRRGGHDVVHAFAPPDALAARLSGRPVVFTCVEVLRRENVADRRLRLTLLRAAVEDSAVVTAADREVADGMRRWMAVDAEVVDPGDVDRWRRLYETAAGGEVRP